MAFRIAYGIAGLLIWTLFYNAILRFAVDASVGYLAAHTVKHFVASPIAWLCANHGL